MRWRGVLNRLIREPLIHFLAIGLALFILYEVVSSDRSDVDTRTIKVDRDALLTFIQFRTKTFQPELAAERLDSLPDAELQLLMDEYIREEALYRESLALGMDQNDYVIKRRLIQSVEFVTNGFVVADVAVSDDQIRDYYENHADDYYVAPQVTFTHVFFDNERHGSVQARALARVSLERLNRGKVPFSDSTRHGDRFPYSVNYVGRTADFVAGHFGDSMATSIFELPPSETTWHGPFESAYGFHNVMLTRMSDGRLPELAEIEDTVRLDARRELLRDQNDVAIQAIVDSYDVEIAYSRDDTGDDTGVE